ncbi:hypothetical protein ABT061_32430 [Streptosporangium sp. NPDC002544]
MTATGALAPIFIAQDSAMRPKENSTKAGPSRTTLVTDYAPDGSTSA